MKPLLGLLLQLLIAAIPVIIAITFHEAAHGYAALILGDDTARQRGRLSLNPLKHVDRFGTIILPAILIATQLITIGHIGFLFGWAKPVPVDARRFPNPRRDMALVASAGPLMNFFLAWLGALAVYLLPLVPGTAGLVLGNAIGTFIIVNLALGLFNLIPLPPLDGGRIAVGVLPLPLAILWARIERFGLLLVVLLVFVVPAVSESAGHRFDPVGKAAARVIPNAYQMVMRLAFHDQPSD